MTEPPHFGYELEIRFGCDDFRTHEEQLKFVENQLEQIIEKYNDGIYSVEVAKITMEETAEEYGVELTWEE